MLTTRIPPLTRERAARLSLQMTQEEVARFLRVNRCYVSLWEWGLLALPKNVEERFWELCGEDESGSRY